VPEVGADHVLVRVHAATLNPADWHFLRGDPLSRGSSGRGSPGPRSEWPESTPKGWSRRLVRASLGYRTYGEGVPPMVTAPCLQSAGSR
jgi:hypothetical protein